MDDFKVWWKSSKRKYHEKMTVLFVEYLCFSSEGHKSRIFCNHTIKLSKTCLNVHVLQLDVHQSVSTL